MTWLAWHWKRRIGTIIVQAVGLPIAMPGLHIAVDRVPDMCRTLVNVSRDGSGCTVIDRYDRELPPLPA